MSLPIGFLVLVGAIIAIAFLRRNSAPKLSPDGRVLTQLQKAGSNLSKPHPVEFFMYLPTVQAAEKVGDILRRDEFEVVVQPAARGPQFLVKATRAIVPSEDNLLALRQRLETIAEKEGGNYDGWGTPVVQ